MQEHITLNAPVAQDEIRLIPLSQGKFAIVDATDYERLMQWKWHVLKAPYTWYAIRRTTLPGGEIITIPMHREIMDVPSGVLVDHKDGNGLNNTRVNLRSASRQQNQFNRPAQANNKSGFKGVSLSKRDKRWRAEIKAGDKRINLGYYDLPEDAARAYDAAAIRLHGEFARLNFPA